MDILYMCDTDAGYNLLVVAQDYLTGWSELGPPKQVTSGKVADFFSKEVLCRFGTPESVVVDKGEEN